MKRTIFGFVAVAAIFVATPAFAHGHHGSVMGLHPHHLWPGSPTTASPTTGSPTTGSPTTGSPTTGFPATGFPTTWNRAAMTGPMGKEPQCRVDQQFDAKKTDRRNQLTARREAEQERARKRAAARK